MEITTVVAGSPAEQAGILAGDQIVMVGDVRPTTTDAVRETIVQYRGRLMPIIVQRGDQTYSLSLTPRTVEETPTDQGAAGVGIQRALVTASGFGQAVTMLGAAFITVNIAPYLMTVTGAQERRHAFAVFQAVGPATAFLGSLVAGLLPGLIAVQLGLGIDQPAPYRLALWLGPLLCFLAIVPMLGADPGRVIVQRNQTAGVDPAPLPLLIFFGVIVFLQAIGEGAVRTFFNVFLDAGLAVLPAQIGAVMGVAQLLPVAVALSIPFLLARWGTGFTLVAALVVILSLIHISEPTRPY